MKDLFSNLNNSLHSIAYTQPVIAATLQLRSMKYRSLYKSKTSIYKIRGPGSSVGIATDYELDGPGSNPGRDEIFRPSRPTLGPTQPPAKGVPGLSRG